MENKEYLFSVKVCTKFYQFCFDERANCPTYPVTRAMLLDKNN